jgi:hypothetical protein
MKERKPMPYKLNPDKLGIVVFMFFLVAGGLKFGFERLQAAQYHKSEVRHSVER